MCLYRLASSFLQPRIGGGSAVFLFHSQGQLRIDRAAFSII